jgi:NAD(P)-dependent dehydrogenase (short-subunit alcohol dehydrogenase family)
MAITPPKFNSLAGKVSFIIGGASGLGRAIAELFADHGATVVIGDIRADLAEQTLKEIMPEGAGMALALDISKVSSIGEAFARVAQRFGRLDIMVNCAAVCLVDPILEVSEKHWDTVFSVNAKGSFFCMQAAARMMLKNKWGRIIMISTPAAKMGFPYFATYGASKAAVDSLMKSAALAWSPDVTVNSIVPGRMTGGMVDQLDVDLARVMNRPQGDLVTDRTKGLPMGRRVEPQEVAAAALWLASTEARYVTAERFNFTGGMELQ